MIIQVKVTNKHAQVLGTPVIVCGNNDYRIRFTFDIEWTPGAVKTARFVYIQDGAVAYTDAVFEGDTVAVPVLANTREVRVGVFEGDLQTTTPAVIPCELSIRCGTGAPVDPTPSQYDQIMELLSQGVGGVSRWSDIPDKPFTYLVSPDTLIWDGNTEGCTLWERPGTGWTYYKVSDSVPSREELANGGSMNWSTSGASTFDSSAVYEQYTKSARVGNYIFICHTDDAAEAGVEAGTYFRKSDDSGYATSFTVSGYIGYGKEQINTDVLPALEWENIENKPFTTVDGKEQINPAVLPETRWSKVAHKPFFKVGGSDTLTWGGDTAGLENDGDYYFVSDSAPTMDDLANGGTFIMELSNGKRTTTTFTSDQCTITGSIIIIYGAVKILPGVGVWFYKGEHGYITSLTIPGYTGFTKEQIDPAVLPDDIGGGVSSWNDLTDKPFGDVSIVREIMPETEITGTPSGDYYVAEFDVSLFTGNEQVMKIVFDGTEYICPNKEDTFGNLILFGEEDTGEPFLLMVWLEMGGVAMYMPDDKPHMVSIAEAEYTKIETEYLPDAVNNAPVRLYTDDIYLYTAIDTSDTSRRVTKSQLKEYFDLGKNVWVCLTDSSATMCMKAENYYLPLPGGGQYGVLFVHNCVESRPYAFYTAEYTAPTT